MMIILRLLYFKLVKELVLEALFDWKAWNNIIFQVNIFLKTI